MPPPAPSGAADRGTARPPCRDTRAEPMPASRQHHHENRLRNRNGTRALLHPGKPETPKVRGVGPVPRGGRRGHSEYSSTIRANRRCESRIVSEVASKQLAIHLNVILDARQAGSGIIRGVASNKPVVRLDVNLKSRPREMGTLRNVILESFRLPPADAPSVVGRAGPARPPSFGAWGLACAPN